MVIIQISDHNIIDTNIMGIESKEGVGNIY